MSKITELLLPKYGYKKTYDRTRRIFKSDPFDTQRTVDFSKNINEDVSIIVEFKYEAEKEGKFKLVEKDALLCINGDTIVHLELNITKLEKLYNTMLLALKSEKL
jgi:hypothetical protein